MGNPRCKRTQAAPFRNIRPEPLLDSEEAAAIMKIHPKTLQRFARQGRSRGPCWKALAIPCIRNRRVD